MEIPEYFTCSGCRRRFSMSGLNLPDLSDRITVEELEAMCEADHPQFGILCDGCKHMYDALGGSL